MSIVTLNKRKKLVLVLMLSFGLVLIGILFRLDYLEKYLRFRTVDCPTAIQKKSSKRLKDKMGVYIKAAQKNGIASCEDAAALSQNKTLVLVEDTPYYIIDDLTHSYPYLTKEGIELLDELGLQFHLKLKGTDLEDTKFIVTSLTRTKESINRLRKRNGNASLKSAHMYGECFDITYKRFFKPYTRLKACHKSYLKETLASVLLELKKDKKCWALTEFRQPCFHVVKR